MKEAEPALTKSLRDCFTMTPFSFGFWLVGQAECNDIRSHGDSDILFMVEHVRHRRRMRRLAGLKAPEWLTGLSIRGGKRAVVRSVKNHAPGGAENAAHAIRSASLGKLPHCLAGLNVECAQDPPARIGRVRTKGAAHVAVPQLERHVGAGEDAAHVVGLYIVERGQ